MSHCYITVLTPTYNRARTLHRVFQSLLQQSFREFEWLIIDDGSTDNTKEIVESFHEAANFPVRYYYKENGGKHTALNMALDYIRGKYTLCIDSDDALEADALRKIHDLWESIPSEEHNRYWCISGRCIDAKTHALVGKPYPENINKLQGVRKKRATLKASGEKCGCQRTDILKQFPFPVFQDTNFVTENMVYLKISNHFDEYCVNDIFRIYYMDEPDSLVKANNKTPARLNSSYYAARFYINECSDQWYYNGFIIFEYINISRLSMLTGRSFGTVIKELNRWYKPLFVAFGYPISWLYLRGIKFFRKDKD